MRALKYAPNIDFGGILERKGDAIMVFVGSEHIKPDNPAFTSQNVYGKRPYAAQSDVLAIMAHMGVVFPLEKSRKNAPHQLFTSPSALRFGRNRRTNFDDRRRIDNDYSLYGVLVALMASEPLDLYAAAHGFAVESQSLNNSSFSISRISLDIADFSLISELEFVPELVDPKEAAKIVFRMREIRCPVAEDPQNTAKIAFKKSYFEDNFDCILGDFDVGFVTNDSVYEFVPANGDKLWLRETVSDPADNKKYSELVIGDAFDLADVKFTEKGFKINNEEFGPFKIFTLTKKIR